MRLLYKIYKVLPVKLRWLVSYLLNDKFIVGFTAFIIKDSKMLLVKQSYQYHWSLISGYIKKGENFEQSIKREILEELGFVIKVERILNVNNDNKKSIITVICLCRIESGELKIDNKEVERAEFFELDKLPEDNILDVHWFHIKVFIKERKES